jgi:hypothetical protein
MNELSRRDALKITAYAFAAVTTAVTIDAVAAADPKKTGWWIKVNTNKTECSSIALQIGTSKKDRRDWRTWKSSDPVEFDVPDDFLTVAELYIHATANPNDKNAWFCVHYKQDGVKHFDFDDDEDHQMKQTDRDKEC